MNSDNQAHVFLTEPKVAQWVTSLEEAGCEVHSITPMKLLYKSNGELLFALLDADVTAPDGTKLLPYIFIRGHACIVVPFLRNVATGQERFLMIEQRRIAHGQMCLEFPAGMLDRHVDDPKGVAVKELFEETGLTLDREMILPLCDSPLHSSPGATDESIYYYGCIVEMDNELYRSFEGTRRGCESENEHITVALKSQDEAVTHLMSLQARLGFHLFDSKRKILEQNKVRITDQ